MDYFVLSLLRSLMSLLSALAPLLVTTALFLILIEALRADHPSDTVSERRRTEHEAATPPMLGTSH